MGKIIAETAQGTVAFECETGRKLVLCIEDNGIDILHRCGGNARCTTCRVEIISGDPGEIQELERDRLAREMDLNERTRLSCQIRLNDDLHVKVINQLSTSGLPDPGPRPEEG
jgi:ferredoxin